MVQEDALTLADMQHSGCLDSGCSSHTLDAQAIPDEVDIDDSQPNSIRTARAGETMSALGRANAGLLQNSLVLKPGTLTQNLVSIPSLDKTGHITIMGNGEGLVYRNAKIKIQGGTLVARAPLDRDTNLYQINNLQELIMHEDKESAMLASAPVKLSLRLLHKRLGHRCNRSIIRYRNLGKIAGIPRTIKMTEQDKAICEACARSKSTRFRFLKAKNKQKPQFSPDSKPDFVKKDLKPVVSWDSDSELSDENEDSETKTLVSSVASILSEGKPLKSTIPKICTDIKGPISVEGLGGERYYQGLIEADTRYLTAYFSSYKSDAPRHVEYHWNTVLKAEGSTATAYQADGAPELISKETLKILAGCNTKMMWSPPYTAELNAVIERNHRTVFESGHAMLLESNLPMMFWPESIAYACLIFNSFPTTTDYGEMSPIEAKYGIIPDVNHFRVFGCICYVHVPKERRMKGFIEKAYKGYFLGVDIRQKAYKVWVIDMNEMMTSAHVAFDEITQVPKMEKLGVLEYAPESKNKKDFDYLIGQVYRDDENNLLYATTRVVVQKGDIVAYRGVYANNTVSKEEARPIHVADVVKMVITYQISSPPIVIVDNRPVTLDVCEASGDPTINAPARATEPEPPTSPGAPKRGRGRSTSKRDDAAPKPPNTLQLEEPVDNPVIASGIESLSARATRAQARSARTEIRVGEADELSEAVNLSYDGLEYTLLLERLAGDSQEYCMLYVEPDEEEIKKYENADLDELHSLIIENNVWTTEDLPPGKKAITAKWVRKPKLSGRLKSRVVGRGFNMIKGIDYNETFAPVAKMATFRIFLTIVAYLDLCTGALDVKTAYLNSPIDEEVYMEPPKNIVQHLEKLIQRLEDLGQKKQISKQIRDIKNGQKLRLNKAIYGTKQGGRQWWLTIDKFLKSKGFTSNPADNCFYTLLVGKDFVLLLLYVDDIIIASNRLDLREKYVKIFQAQWRVTYGGPLKEFLNIQLTRDRAKKRIHMSQEQYICRFFEQFGFQADPSVETPMQENIKIPAEEEQDLSEKQKRFVSAFPYQQIIGCLLYANVCTMPTISYAVSVLSQFNKAPTFIACKAVVRLCKYVYNARKLGIWLGGGRGIVGMYDADWAGCIKTRKSRGGCINFLGNGPITWYSKLQSQIALSTMGAEHGAAVPAIQNNTWIRNVVKSASIPGMTYVYATTLYGDNKPALAIAENPMHHQKSKHIHLKYQYVQDQVTKHNVVMEYVNSKDNCADGMTKPVGKVLYKRHLDISIGLGAPQPSAKKLKTLESDSLECPRCSCLLPPDLK